MESEEELQKAIKATQRALFYWGGRFKSEKAFEGHLRWCWQQEGVDYTSERYDAVLAVMRKMHGG